MVYMRNYYNSIDILAPNVADRFKSPVVTAVARRQLAFDSGDASPQGSPVRVVQGKRILKKSSLVIIFKFY